MAKPLIYCVDDEEDIRELYLVALSNAGFECSAFEGGAPLFAAVKERKPDMILLDIMLEAEDGFSILQKLKAVKNYEDISVIMVSAKGEELSKVKGLNLGADDYIAKPFGVMELVARINANLRKRPKASALSYKNFTVNESNHEILLNGSSLSLTLKEYGLLKALIAAAPNVVSREELFSLVWGEEFFGESRTLDIHIAAIRKIIAPAAEIETVRGVGYRLK